MPTTRSKISKGTPKVSLLETPATPAGSAGMKRKLEDVEVQLDDQSGEADGRVTIEIDSSPARPTKIAKVAPPFEMHETHWYLDGNVFLQIGGTRFKVHRSRLASASSWFQTLFDKYMEIESPNYDEIDETRQKYIDAVLESEETIHDLPLFHLDSRDDHTSNVPTTAEFVALLNGVYNGIDYAFDPPSIDEVALLARAAVIFDAYTFIDYATKYLAIVFPGSPLKLSAEPSVYVAVRGIGLARYDVRFGILGTAFYDLARAPVTAINECAIFSTTTHTRPTNGTARTESILRANDVHLSPYTTQQEMWKTFDDFSHHDHLTLNMLQKHLSASWDEILNDALFYKSPDGCDARCGIKNVSRGSIMTKVMPIKKAHICDPILGIKALIQENLFKQYCSKCNGHFNKVLKDRRSAIWKNIRTKWV